MKKTLYLILFLTLAAIAYLLFFFDSQSPTNSISSYNAEQQRFPWHIQTLENGSTRVFKITLGETTFEQAIELLGINREIGIIVGEDNHPRLEMYYSNFSAGAILGKLIVMTDADPYALSQLIEKLDIVEYLKTGARKFIPNTDELGELNNARIKQLIFLPSVNLDEDIIIQRFGKASEVIQIDKRVSYYSYPDKGLLIALYPESKDVMHYVHPKDMNDLIEKIKKKLSLVKTTN